MDENPSTAEKRRGESNGLLSHGRCKRQHEDNRENHYARRNRAVRDKENEEHDHRQEGEHRLGIVNGGPRQAANLDGGFYQRNKVEDESEPHGRFNDLTENIAFLAEKEKGVQQSHGIEDHRYSKPQ